MAYALITGATSGIGKETSMLLAQEGYSLIITGRRKERLDQIKEELSQLGATQVIPLAFDIRDHKEMKTHFEGLKTELSELEVLVNNAGGALGVSSIDEGDTDQWDQMIDANIKGLLYVSRYCLPLLKKRKNAHVVNIGSVAGRWVYPGGNVYCATKHAVRAISEAMRMDLIGSGIRVTNIEPGMVETEFSVVRLGDEKKANEVYQGMNPLKARDIAESILWCLKRPNHVNIHEMVIYPTDQAHVTMVHRS